MGSEMCIRDRFALEQKVKELNEQLKESGNSDGTKVTVDKYCENKIIFFLKSVPCAGG